MVKALGVWASRCRACVGFKNTKLWAYGLMGLRVYLGLASGGFRSLSPEVHGF